MRNSKLLKKTIATMACAGLLMPASLVQAAGQPAATPVRAEQSLVSDVALGHGGTFHGQVLDVQGAPVAGESVSVQLSGVSLASATTDAEGRFAVQGLRGGTYTVVTKGSGSAYRLWAADTAPPSANRAALIVRGQDSVLGQNGGPLLTNGTLLILGVTGAIVAGGVIVANDDDDDDNGSAS